MVAMRNFQDTFEPRKRSFISDFSICMTVILNILNILISLLTLFFSTYLSLFTVFPLGYSHLRKPIMFNWSQLFRDRSSRPEVFCKKGVLKNFEKFTGNHLCQSLFFNKVAGLAKDAFSRTHF